MSENIQDSVSPRPEVGASTEAIKEPAGGRKDLPNDRDTSSPEHGRGRSYKRDGGSEDIDTRSREDEAPENGRAPNSRGRQHSAVRSLSVTAPSAIDITWF
jgi:hypothetical protein